MVCIEIKAAPKTVKFKIQDFYVSHTWFNRAGVSNPAPGELLSYRFQLQPQSNTPEPANQVFKATC